MQSTDKDKSAGSEAEVAVERTRTAIEEQVGSPPSSYWQTFGTTHSLTHSLNHHHPQETILRHLLVSVNDPYGAYKTAIPLARIRWALHSTAWTAAIPSIGPTFLSASLSIGLSARPSVCLFCIYICACWSEINVLWWLVGGDGLRSFQQCLPSTASLEASWAFKCIPPRGRHVVRHVHA